jgi:hypothetical protein
MPAYPLNHPLPVLLTFLAREVEGTGQPRAVGVWLAGGVLAEDIQDGDQDKESNPLSEKEARAMTVALQEDMGFHLESMELDPVLKMLMDIPDNPAPGWGKGALDVKVSKLETADGDRWVGLVQRDFRHDMDQSQWDAFWEDVLLPLARQSTLPFVCLEPADVLEFCQGTRWRNVEQYPLLPQVHHLLTGSSTAEAMSVRVNDVHLNRRLPSGRRPSRLGRL